MKQSTAFGIPVGYPDLQEQPLLGRRNLVNVGITLWVPIPAIVCTLVLFRWFPGDAIPPDPGLLWPGTADEAAALLLHHPILTANLLFLVFVDLQFWLIALYQRSSWLIDPYWTLIPLFIVWFYSAHPLAQPAPLRHQLGWFLLVVWSGRLTWNYLRRERWRLGFREDWRFAKKRNESRHFWWVQFFYVYVAQQFMLVGLTLPFYAIEFRDAPLGVGDWVLAALALSGLWIAHTADTSLDSFMRRNAEAGAQGDTTSVIFDRGIWGWSRHPNYFGEQLFWWSIAGFGVLLGLPWVIAGTLLNSCVLAVVTVMTERRMASDPRRRELYREYQRRTSVWVPWPPRARAQIATQARREKPLGSQNAK
jgi:steroid 5-alpha reductase family enzyme